MRPFLPLLAVALSTMTAPAGAHDPGQAKYLGNEGVLVTLGETKILFDAFYAESFDGTYTLVPPKLETAMMDGEKPFDGVDAVFISHIHPDHFNTRKTVAYMRRHDKVRLYAGYDVAGAIKASDIDDDDPLLKRIVPVHVRPGGAPARFSIEGIEVEAYSIPHSGGVPVAHFAYRVTLDQAATVMHLGDSEAKDSNFAPYQSDLDAKKTDLALAPAWMLLLAPGKQILEQRIRPAKVIGIHVEAAERSRPDQARKEVGADLFLEPGETRPIP